MRLLRPPGAKQHSKKHAFCALRAQNSAPHALPRRISRPAGAKQPTAPKRRRLSRPQTRNNFNHKSPRHARGDLFFSRRSSPSWHYDSRALSGAPIVPLPRNRLASSATGGASPISVRACGACAAAERIPPKKRGRRKAPPRRGINPIPFMSRKRGRRKSGVLALHFGAPGMGNN